MSGDLISRQAALKSQITMIAQGLDWIPAYHIEQLPSAERHGRMVIEPDATVMHCNVCGWAYQYYAGLEEEWNYCPHCGAKMDEGKDND